MPPVQLGPIIGLIVQVAVLVVLAVTVGLGVAGWIIGLGYGVVLCALLLRAMHRAGAEFGPADWVTLTRAALAGCVAALTADSFTRMIKVEVLVAIAVVALVLDAVDGQVARRTGTASGFGARFDMEVDAFLILVLSVYVAPAAGAWVLAIGGMRYAYVVAGWALPWLCAAVPPRYWRKVVAAIQGIVLVITAAGLLGTHLMVLILIMALGLLVESFGRDIVWQWRHRSSLA